MLLHRPSSINAMPKNAVILFSGGLDSSTVLSYAKQQGFVCHALTFAYGQKHLSEIAAATRVAAHLGVTHHHLIELNPMMFAPSALTPHAHKMPDDANEGATPVTYVPARNTIFLAI